MLRSVVLFIAAAFALAACVPDQPEEFDFAAEALKRGAEKVEQCRLSECTKLDLDGTHLADFTVLNDMPHITKLMMSRTNIADLSEISGMIQLRELHISWTDVDDLSALSAFSKLELLHVNNLSKDPDYAPVYRMTSLKELSLDARRDDGVGFVRNMRRLETLLFMDGQVGDLSPLAGNRTIKTLALQVPIPDDIGPVTRMRALRTLDLGLNWLEPERRERFEELAPQVEIQVQAPLPVC